MVMEKCIGITRLGTRCKHTVLPGKDYCYQHSGIGFRQSKPDDCIVCCESLEKQRTSLSCGHWVHTNCIIQSAKAECPICRAPLKMGKRAMHKLEQLRLERRRQGVLEEEEEIRQQLEDHFVEIFSPTLYNQIYSIIGLLIDDPDDITDLLVADIIEHQD